jgi:hypothetical protein
MPDPQSAEPIDPTDTNRIGRQTASLQAAMQAFLLEMQKLDARDRLLLVDQLFLSVSSALAYARTCAAGLRCMTDLDATPSEAALREFFDQFREVWISSVVS